MSQRNKDLQMMRRESTPPTLTVVAYRQRLIVRPLQKNNAYGLLVVLPTFIHTTRDDEDYTPLQLKHFEQVFQLSKRNALNLLNSTSGFSSRRTGPVSHQTNNSRLFEYVSKSCHVLQLAVCSFSLLRWFNPLTSGRVGKLMASRVFLLIDLGISHDHK
ncbi:hypothetical protein NW765_002420 [Fusarium oxysporum]|nr:hypothetical protein NW765_002420 [Fusarium oxysporum]KAJ4284529.1 hypothetical protein NW764_002070 [Fusarium oxysporum]